MKTVYIKKVVVLVVLALTSLVQLMPASKTNAESPQLPMITIDSNSWQVPPDITGPINLQNAAIFAWKEFIALNWPAVYQNGALNTRDMPEKTGLFGDVSSSLVWHTFRAKAEIYPGTGDPNGYANSTASNSYGYDALPPAYVYDPNKVGGDGTIKRANNAPATNPPFINLDENSEIGLNMMFAGSGVPAAPGEPGQQILFMAKANRVQYNYVAANKWWNRDPKAPFLPIQNTANYIQQNAQPLPPNTTSLPDNSGPAVSFPNGTIEVKAAFRQLTSQEMSSGRFHTTYVRHYTIQNGLPVYIDELWGLVAIHIIQKTPSSPYFVYATFSQADNLLDVNGNRIEDEDGKLISNQTATPFDPDITSRNATSASPGNANSIQALSPLSSPRVSGKRLYYQNVSSAPATPQGIINMNKRKHDIPDTIIQVNQAAHAAIVAYNQKNNVKNSPWPYYKLVNVQYQPYDKPAGTTYTGALGGPDPATYYQANEVVESDYNLQVFSGKFQNPPSLSPVLNTNNLITDYNDDGSVFKNVYHNGSGYLMGGCMGCHGNAQVAGADFSFIFLGGRVDTPDTVGMLPNQTKFNKLLMRR
jgi:hypothetical protein